MELEFREWLNQNEGIGDWVGATAGKVRAAIEQPKIWWNNLKGAATDSFYSSLGLPTKKLSPEERKNQYLQSKFGADTLPSNDPRTALVSNKNPSTGLTSDAAINGFVSQVQKGTSAIVNAIEAFNGGKEVKYHPARVRGTAIKFTSVEDAVLAYVTQALIGGPVPINALGALTVAIFQTRNFKGKTRFVNKELVYHLLNLSSNPSDAETPSVQFIRAGFGPSYLIHAFMLRRLKDMGLQVAKNPNPSLGIDDTILNQIKAAMPNLAYDPNDKTGVVANPSGASIQIGTTMDTLQRQIVSSMNLPMFRRMLDTKTATLALNNGRSKESDDQELKPSSTPVHDYLMNRMNNQMKKVTGGGKKGKSEPGYYAGYGPMSLDPTVDDAI